MGIDKGDVEYVIFGTLSHSVEDFYQQYGRGGRGGNKSEAIIFYHPNDVIRVSQLICGQRCGLTSGQTTAKMQENLLRLLDLQDYLQSPLCRRTLICEYFGDLPIQCGGKNVPCDNCRGGEKAPFLDVSTHVRKLLAWFREHKTCEFTLLREFLKGGQKVKHEICGLLRHWPSDEVERLLRMLRQVGILSFDAERIGITSRISWKLSLGTKTEECLGKPCRFPIVKDAYAAIMALEAADSNNNLAAISSTPLDTQTRNVLENAMNQYSTPSPVQQNKSAPSFDIVGQF